MEGDTEPRYVPFDGRPHAISMGLRPLGATRWLEPDRHRARDLAAKRVLLRERHAEVVATVPLGDAGSRETLALVRAEVADAATAVDDALHPIDAAGRLVQEDLCVMAREDDGRWLLAAACVCAPSRWRLADKVGRDLRAIHGPVPDYDSIARSTDLFFDRIDVDRPVWRTNWTLIDDAALFQPAPPDPARPPTRPLVVEDVRLRVERQTLRRLPESDAVLFTIRTYVDPLDALSPGARADLAATLAHVDADLVDYRGWSELLPVVREWLAEA